MRASPVKQSSVKKVENEMVIPVTMKDGELRVGFVVRPLGAGKLATQTIPKDWFTDPTLGHFASTNKLRRIASYTNSKGQNNKTAISIVCVEDFSQLKAMIVGEHQASVEKTLKEYTISDLDPSATTATGEFRYCVKAGLHDYVLDHLRYVASRIKKTQHIMPEGHEEVVASLWKKNRIFRQQLAERISMGAVKCADEELGLPEAAAGAPSPPKRVRRLKSPYQKGALAHDLQTKNTPLEKDYVQVLKEDCLNAAASVMRLGNPIVLNMANAWRAGGGFAHGAGAQEEELYRRTDASDNRATWFSQNATGIRLIAGA